MSKDLNRDLLRGGGVQKIHPHCWQAKPKQGLNKRKSQARAERESEKKLSDKQTN
jgi:hypothetical protein